MFYKLYIYIYIYIYIYTYIYYIYAVLPTIFSQPTLTLNCYSAMVPFDWSSLLPKWKHTSTLRWPNMSETDPGNPPHPKFQVRQEPCAFLLLCWNTGLKLIFHSKCTIKVSLERPFGKNSITQESVYRFALQINALVPILDESNWTLFTNIL